MALKRAIIGGEQIQAVGFRESIAAALKQMGYKGTARNIRDSQEVWIEVLEGEKRFGEEELEKILKEIRKKNPLIGEGIKHKIEEIRDETAEKLIRDSKEFKVIREDDLHEMVWALLGAGNLFRHTSKEVKELLDIKKTEKQMQLKSLEIELSHAQNTMSKIDGTPLRELACLKECISSPKAELQEELLGELISLFYEYTEFANTDEKDRKEQEKPMISRLDKLQKQLKEVQKEL